MDSEKKKKVFRLRLTEQCIEDFKVFVARGRFATYDDAMRWLLAHCPLPKYR